MRPGYSSIFHAYPVQGDPAGRRIGFERDTLSRLVLLRTAWSNLQQALRLLGPDDWDAEPGHPARGMWISAQVFDVDHGVRYATELRIVDDEAVLVRDITKPDWLPERQLRVIVEGSSQVLRVDAEADRALRPGETIAAGDSFKPREHALAPVPPKWVGFCFDPDEHFMVIRPGTLRVTAAA